MTSLPALPSHPDDFVGRAREVEQIGELLASARLLTLTGPGGVGKTRLALHAAHALRHAFPDGVAFVDLAPLRDPAQVLAQIRQALGVAQRDAAPPAGRQTLLVLDSCEQVLAAGPDIAALLASTPGLAVLATSRAPLRQPGEQELLVPPLGYPAADQAPALDQLVDFPAVRLFLIRAQQVRPDFALTARNAQAVAAICRRLDGLPLAIELAAARTRLLPPAQLLERLDRSLDVLGRGGGPGDRHQTMRAAIAWSYELLSEGERALFERLSVLAGGGTLDAIASICDGAGEPALIDRLEALVAHSLVLMREQASGDARFAMLETIREYAAERAAGQPGQAALRARHARYFCALAEEAGPHLVGAGQGDWLRRLEADYENLRAAAHWSLEADGGVIAQRIGGALWRFLFLHGHLRDGRAWLERALDADAEGAAAEQAALEGRAVEDTGVLVRRARAFFAVAYLAWSQIEYAQAEGYHRRSLALFRAAGDERGVAAALHGVGTIRALLDDYDAAERLYAESLELKRRVGDELGVALTLNNLGFLAEQRGDDDAARRHYEESIALKRRVGEQAATAKSLANLSGVLIRIGDLAAARSALAEGLGLAVSSDAFVYAAEIIHWTACLASACGRAEQAARLFGAAEGLNARYGADLHTEDYVLTVQQVRSVRERMRPAAFAAAWRAGRQMDLEEAVALAREALAAPPQPGATPELALPEPLSERELEVLRLLAAGLSNSAIAARLVISVNTVQTHLRNIYGKLGVASRSAAVRFAFEHGLAAAGAADERASE